MNVDDFLFPRDLEVRPVTFKKILFIGSCLSEAYVDFIGRLLPDTTIEMVLYNNAIDLPVKTREEIGEYNFQYIQLPLRSILTDAVVRVCERFDGPDKIDFLDLGKQNIDLFLDKVLKYNEETGLLTFVSNFVVPQVDVVPSMSELGMTTDLTAIIRELNYYLAQRVTTYKYAFIADVDMIASSLGKKNFFDDAIYFYSHGSIVNPIWSHRERFQSWSAPEASRIEHVPDLDKTYENKSADFYRAIFRQMEAMYRTFHQIDMVKVVFFDLDNTMWRGLIGEHYAAESERPSIDNWPTGIWEAIQHLRQRGIVVSIASKNDEKLTRERWNDAVPLPFVRFEDFVLPQINWDPKAQNIKKVLDLLSITPASAVFVDDNPVERESVSTQLPGIRVIGSDPFTVRRILLWSPETQIAYRTKETANRESMLRKQVERKSAQAALTRDEFLLQLRTSLKLWRIDSIKDSSFGRAFELVNKTNQFNTNGNRWAVEQLSNYFNDGGRIYAFAGNDRYTEYGTVGAVLVRGEEIEQFVMSCRVLGFDGEIAALHEIVNEIRAEVPSATVKASIRETKANTPCRDLYVRAGFEKVKDGEFVLTADRAVTPTPHVSIAADEHVN